MSRESMMPDNDGASSRSAKSVPEWLNSSAWYSKSSHPNEDDKKENEEKDTQAEASSIAGTHDQSGASGGEILEDLSAQGHSYAPPSQFFSSPDRSNYCSSSSDGKDSKEIISPESRADLFTMELARKRIHFAELQRLASEGIPDSRGIRAVTWKLLLGYLPKNREAWDIQASKKRAEYVVFRQELLINPSEVTKCDVDEQREWVPRTEVLQRQEISHGDHPLSHEMNSIWNQFFQDKELVEQIDRDVKRTHPDMQFFSGDSEASHENQEAMKRALFIFAKLNPGIKYVQGMNEVLAPLYYVFKNDPDTSNMVNAEADAFFCFVELFSDVRDNFCKQLDNSTMGVDSTLGQLQALLKRHDEALWRHLNSVSKVKPQFYAFRWITLLLTQEFKFPDILRLWDSILSNPDGPLEILLRFCCAMLISVRNRLLAGDFTDNLKLLQHFPSMDVHQILKIADELKD